jgi:PAS domain S-box-containing protein
MKPKSHLTAEDSKPAGTARLPEQSIIEHATLAVAVEQAADSIVVTDIRGKIQYVNPAFTAMTGYTVDEAVGRNPNFLKSGLHSKEFFKELWDTILSGQVWQGKVTNRRKNRTTYREEMRIAPVRGSSGEIVSFIAVKRDITAQQEADETQALLAAIVENSEDSIISCTPDGTVRTFNRGAELIFGYAAKEVIGRHMSMLVPPDRAAVLEQLVKRLLQGESISQYEAFCLRKDGSKFPVSTTGFPIKNSAGEVVAVSNILRDVSERARIEEALRESEEGFRNMADSCPAMMWVSGPTGEMDFLNRAYLNFHGLTYELARGHNWRSLIHPDDAPEYLEKADNAIREHTSFNAEARVRRADGEWRMIGSRGEPRFSPQGEYLGHIGLRADITERFQAEQLRIFQHSLIRTTFEVSLDGILVVNAEGKVVSHNRRFLEVWRIPAAEVPDLPVDLAIGVPEELLLSRALDRVKDPEAFSKQVQEIYADPSANGHGETELKDGRILERYSTVLRNEDGKYLARAWFFRDITERKQAEQARQFQHSLIRTTFDQSLHGILVVSGENKIVSFNQKYFDIWKIPVSEIMDGPFDVVKGAQDHPLLSKVLERVKDPDNFLKRVRDLYANPDANDECEIELKDGRTLERYSTSLRNQAGGYLARAWFFRDITERKLSEQALRESEERFRIMADGCPMPMWVTDSAGRIRFINQALREFTGAEYEEVEGYKWQLFCHPDDAQWFINESRRSIEEQAPLKAESRFKRADGQWRWLAVNVVPRFSPSGESLGRIGLGTDITERKLAEQESQFQLSLISAIFEASLDGILVINNEDVVVSHNQRLLDLWRIALPDISEDSPEEIIGAHRQPLLSAALDRVKDQENYLKHIEVNSDHGDRIDSSEVELKNGRTLERYSTSLKNQRGEHLGRATFFRDITESKRAEQALRESQEQFRIMADCCPMGIWVTNAKGETMFANWAYRRFSGITSEDVDPKAWISMIHPDDAPAFTRVFERSLQEHTPFQAEQRTMRADGEWRWVECFAEPRFAPDGEFQGLVGTSKDITDRKQAEQALLNSEEKFRELAENIHEVFWLRAPESDDFLYVSPAYERVWGMTCASVYQNQASRLEAIHPDDLGPSRLVFARQLQGEDVETEYRIHTPDGQEKWIRSRAFPIRDQLGQLVRIAGIAEDITERKHHEEELSRAQAEAEAANRLLSSQNLILDSERRLLRAFLDNIPDFMYVKDAESRFVVANLTVARHTGVEKPEDLLGKTDFDLFPAEIAKNFYEDDQSVIRTGQPIVDREETVGVDAANQPQYLLTTKVPLFDSEGHVTGIAGMGRDITVRKMMDDALRESNRELLEATDWANKMALEAEAASRAKSEFLANMSHEIRTPMNGVLGMNSLLLGTDLNQEQRHYAEVVESSAKSLLTVIDDILDYSKAEAGRLEIDIIDFNLHALVDDLAEIMAERVGDKRLEFVCAVAPDVSALLRGDPGRLRQVLLNLASNAMKFTHQGEVVVRVNLVSETDTEVSLRFTVRDTGIGIPQDKQKMLFTSFTQVDASTTRRYGGTGLGLAICKQLVELMGGKIGLESVPGQGSEFWFTIRLGKQLASRQPDTSSVAVQGTRILVVDDNATNREVLTAQLQSWGAVVAAVESGSTALACLRYAVAAGSPFQLAVLDMMMPGMDGAALGRAILEEDTLRSIPLVMMTSFGQRGDAHRFKEIGFAAYLIKPVRQSDLHDCLVAVLTGERQEETRALITRHSLRELRRGHARILLVEDNLTNQEVASGLLRRLGWHADVTSNGKQALQALETQPYDLVLMDVQMPEMDGYEATRLIRDPHSKVLNRNIPIIATTAHSMQGDDEKCIQAGMSDYISKPIDPNKLAKIVEKWLTRKVHSAHEEAPLESGPTDEAPPPQPEVESLIFNREKFLECMMGDEEFAREVAAGFTKELPTLLSRLKEGFERKDIAFVWKQAHKMKGSAANVGGEALRDVAKRVEQAGEAGDLEEVTRWIPELEEQCARLKDALQKW